MNGTAVQMPMTDEQIVRSLRATMIPSRHPNHAAAQLEWARSIIAQDGQAPADLIAASRALMELSDDAAERSRAQKVNAYAREYQDHFRQLWVGGMVEPDSDLDLLGRFLLIGKYVVAVFLLLALGLLALQVGAVL